MFAALRLMSKLTKGHVREALVYEFMVSPVVRQGKGPSQYMLKFFHQVLFIIPLQWLQLSLWKQMDQNKCCSSYARHDTPGQDSCYHCGHVGYNTRLPPFHRFVTQALLTHLATHLPQCPRLRVSHLHSVICRQRDLREVHTALASHP